MGLHGKERVRSPLDLSQSPRLSEATRSQVLLAEMQLARVPGNLAATSKGFLSQEQACTLDRYSLYHHLSSFELWVSSELDEIDNRSYGERLLLDRHYSELLCVCNSGQPRQIFASVVRLVEAAIDSSAPIRMGSMTVRSGANEACIVLPDSFSAFQQWHMVSKLLGTPRSDESPIVVAVWLFVAILNAHLFVDGNGRLSRMLFNFLLRRAGMGCEAYIPLFAAIRASRGGYEIRLREAEIFNRWDPVVRYICKVIDISFQGRLVN